jgi:hypothetical protein
MVQQVGDRADPGFGEALGALSAETLHLADVDCGETG